MKSEDKIEKDEEEKKVKIKVKKKESKKKKVEVVLQEPVIGRIARIRARRAAEQNSRKHG